jgi:hypothetical protein
MMFTVWKTTTFAGTREVGAGFTVQFWPSVVAFFLVQANGKEL